MGQLVALRAFGLGAFPFENCEDSTWHGHGGRWWWMFPQRKDADGNPQPPRKTDLGMLLADEQKVAELRRRLSSIS